MEGDPKITTALTLLIVGSFVTLVFLIVRALYQEQIKAPESLPAYQMIVNPAGNAASLTAASLTTAQRKARTLDNPVGTLNGQQVYLKVSTNPPR